MSDYLTVVYNPGDRPLTDYPAKLCAYLFDSFGMEPGMSMLEPGAGRGEHLYRFRELGLNVSGVDLAPSAADNPYGLSIRAGDVSNGGLPWPDNSFDIIYSKSFIEHIRNPMDYVQEAFRVLKPGGLFLTLTPDWETQYKTFYDDYTHVSPFTIISLRNIYRVGGFESVQTLKFRQLPIVWKHPALNLLCDAISPFIHHRTRRKFLRWSRELLLIGVGRKP